MGQERIPALEGLVVVDIVEGSALASLGHMAGVLARRPISFPSPMAAVNWALRSGARYAKVSPEKLNVHGVSRQATSNLCNMFADMHG